ncbi:MAG: polysaccharide biosynthesis tyrosine autokinase, partial [Anaerolineae bacterium]|nr:polysaccharide biosynthesis tyrosine autokinase [Anaerolineae bacterium]
MQLHYIGATIRKRLWIVLLTVLVGTGISLWYSLAKPLMYRAEATLVLNPMVTQENQAYSPVELAEDLAPTYISYLQTETFLDALNAQTNLDVSLDELRGSVQAELVPKTQFFKIAAISASPDRAQALANAVADVFILETSRQQQERLAARRQADEDTVRLRQQLEEELRFYDEQSAFVRTRIAELRAQGSSPERDEELLRLQTYLVNLEDLRIKAMEFLGRLEPASTESSPATAMVVDYAKRPERPLPRGILPTMGIALGISLVAGLAFAFVPDLVDFTVRTPEDLDLVLNTSTLGAIGIIEYGEDDEDKVEHLVTEHYPRSSAAEAFRTLRTNLRFARPDQDITSLLVTSARPGEGKSLVAANLAVAIAQEGKRVILVDGDLRRPSVHRFFGLPNRVGLTNFILDTGDDIAGYLQDAETENLRVLTSGPLPPNPLDMVASRRADLAIQRLMELCEVLIMDSPPVLTVADAMVLATKVKAAILVVEAGTTRRDVIIRAYRTLQ